jgi:outer membrane protein
MLPMRKGRALIRPLALAWVCLPLGLIPGCSHSRPLVNLPPAVSSADATAEMPRLLPIVAAVPGESPPPATIPRRIPSDAGGPPPASDGAVRLASLAVSAGAPPSLLLSLPEAIQLGLQYNPRLRAALAAIERARGQEQAAFAPFLPQIDMLNRYVATSKTSLPGAPGPTGAINITGVSPYSAGQSELQLQWTLYDFGRTAGRYGQAGMREKIAELQAARAHETVTYDVATAYFDALEAAAIRKIAVEAIRRAEAVLEDVRARAKGGVALRDDILRGEVQLSESRDALVRAEDAEIAALARLNNALGRDASLPLHLAEGPSAGAFHVTLAECLQRAANGRPEVGVARDRVAAAQFGRRAAKGEFLPRVLLLGSLGRVDGEGVVNGWQEGVGIHLNVPLYHGGANRGNLRAADADILQAAADAQSIVNDISLEVTLAHRGVRSAQARVALARPAVEQSRETLRLVRERYRNGTATPTDVVDAETARTRSEQRYASASIEYLSALARLAYVMGDNAGGLGGLCELLGPLEGPALEKLPMPRLGPPLGGVRDEG